MCCRKLLGLFWWWEHWGPERSSLTRSRTHMELEVTEARPRSRTRTLSRRKTKFKRSRVFSIPRWYYELLFARRACVNTSFICLRLNSSDSVAAVLLPLGNVSITLAQKERTGSLQCWWGHGAPGTLIHCWRKYKLAYMLRENVWQLFTKLKIHPSHKSGIRLVGFYLRKKMKSYLHAKISTWTHFN